MNVIWKYELPLEQQDIEIEMPVGGRILHVEPVRHTPAMTTRDYETITMWVEFWEPDTKIGKGFRRLRIEGTGHPYNAGAAYVATCPMRDGYVWHLFDRGYR